MGVPIIRIIIFWGLYWGVCCIGIMEKKMETTTVLWGYILGLYWGCIGIMEIKWKLLSEQFKGFGV